jgi:hypothetical protein
MAERCSIQDPGPDRILAAREPKHIREVLNQVLARYQPALSSTESMRAAEELPAVARQVRLPALATGTSAWGSDFVPAAIES